MDCLKCKSSHIRNLSDSSKQLHALQKEMSAKGVPDRSKREKERERERETAESAKSVGASKTIV
jgi:hypothetical protein